MDTNPRELNGIRTTMMKLCAQPARIWSAVTCHRFCRFGDLSPKQGRVQRPGRFGHRPAFDGDKSPAESADKSAHSRVVAARPHWVHPCPSVVTWASPSRGGEGAGAPCAFVSDTRFRLLPPLGGEGRDEGVARHTERPRLQDAARPLTPTLSPEGERERLTLFRRKEVRAS